MVQIVEVNGEEIEFPDEMSDQEIEAVLQQQFGSPAQQPQPQQQGPVPTGRGIAGQRRQRELSELRAEAERSGIPLARDLPEIGAAPEMNRFDMDAFRASLGATFTFGDEETAQILEQQLGAQIAQDVEGEYVATFPSGETYAINRPGLSGQDLAKGAAAIAAFTPAGRAKSLIGMGLASAATQTGIEAGQVALGGEANPEDVVMAGVAAPVVAKAISTGKSAIDNFRRSVRSSKPLIDVETGQAAPQFEKALEKYDIDVGALIDDQANLPVIYSADKPAQVVDNIIKKQIKTGKTPKYLAKLRLNEKGNIVSDDLGETAIKQGFDGGDIVAAKAANKATRDESRRMLRMQRAIMSDKSNLDNFRPSDAVGDAVMSRFNFLRNEANRLSNQLNKMASKELTVSGRKLIGDGSGSRLKGLDIDPANIERQVFEGLDRLGVEGLERFQGQGIALSDAVFDRAFFEGSDIAVDKTSQRIIRDVFKLLKHNPDGPIDALRAHKVKRQIDSLIDFNKKSSQGLTESGRRFAKSVRAAMNDEIRRVSPKYAKVNDDLSTALQAMNAIEDSVGRRIDLFDANANQAIGTEMRKLLSNYGTRQTLNNSLNQIDDAARELGGAFDVDFRQLNRFANVLDRRFGSVAENSFKGNIDAALDLNRLRSTSVKEAVVEKGLSKIADKFGPNDKKALDTMQKILFRGQ